MVSLASDLRWVEHSSIDKHSTHGEILASMASVNNPLSRM